MTAKGPGTAKADTMKLVASPPPLQGHDHNDTACLFIYGLGPWTTPADPAPPHQKTFPQGKNEVHKRGRKIEPILGRQPFFRRLPPHTWTWGEAGIYPGRPTSTGFTSDETCPSGRQIFVHGASAKLTFVYKSPRARAGGGVLQVCAVVTLDPPPPAPVTFARAAHQPGPHVPLTPRVARVLAITDRGSGASGSPNVTVQSWALFSRWHWQRPRSCGWSPVQCLAQSGRAPQSCPTKSWCGACQPPAHGTAPRVTGRTASAQSNIE